MVEMGDPLRELPRVGDRGGQEDVVHVVREQDDRLLPHHAALLVPHVVDLVEDDPADLAHDLAAAVQHRPEDLRGHDEAGGGGVDGHVPRHQTHVRKLLVKFPVLLVTERLDGSRVDNTLEKKQ